jgi:hypothetical protein
MLIAAAVAAAVLAADRTDPVAFFSAEGQVVSAKRLVPGEDSVLWTEVTFRVKRCIAGKCTPQELVTVQAPTTSWHAERGEVMGLVRYAWQDEKGMPRTWSLALSLKDDDQKERFDRESEVAVAGTETPESGTALAYMRMMVPEPKAGATKEEKAPVAKR